VLLWARFGDSTMYLLHVLTLALKLSALTFGGCAAQMDVTDAPFAFEGIVDEFGGSNVPSLPKGTNTTATVKVKRLLFDNDTLSQIVGETVTIRLPAKTLVTKRGQDLLFFVSGLSFGATMAFADIGEKLPSELPGVTADAAKRVVAKWVDKARVQAMGSKSIYFLGRVDVSPSSISSQPITEHDPQWAVAHITRLWAFSKGVPKSIPLYFPQSRDQSWVRCPKFKKGDWGFWIARQAPDGLKGALPANVFTTLDAKDFVKDLDRIGALLKALWPTTIRKK